MKTKIIKIFSLFLSCLMLFISCGTALEENEKDEIKFITRDVDYDIQKLAEKLGDVNRILDPEGKEVTDSGSYAGIYSSARFNNGDELNYSYPYTLYFHAYLVEYNEFTNSDVLNWMEKNEFNSVTECNFHQKYKDVTINPQKKYVEVCSDVDANNKVIYCSIRIHYPKNNQECDGDGKFYGIDCNFDPAFTIDTNAGRNIKTKEEAIYVYGADWNKGENPYAGKTFKFLKYEKWRKGELISSIEDGRSEFWTFKDDELIIKLDKEKYSFKYVWNAKYKCIYLFGSGAGGGGIIRFELKGKELKQVWGYKGSGYDLYEYTYYELVQ